jgi:MFS family permease
VRFLLDHRLLCRHRGGLGGVERDPLSLRQAIVPDRLMGRVVGVIRLIGFGSIPVGALLGGLVARALGLRAPFLLGAAVLVLAALAAAPVITTGAVEAARAEAGAGAPPAP